MDQSSIKFEIERLEQLLKGKQAEYEVFGITSADMEADSEIRRKIINLKGQLN